MIFSFSLYAAPLLVILVTYFGIELEDLAGGKLPKDSKIYYYQYQK